MIFAGTRPVDWLLSGLLALAWLTLLATRKQVRLWFFIVAAVLALLSFSAGIFAGRLELADIDCTPENLCFSMNQVGWWLNAILGLLTTLALAVMTLVIQAVLAVLRRVSASRASAHQ